MMKSARNMLGNLTGTSSGASGTNNRRVCLIGSTGSGKSTLGNVLLGLDIDGTDFRTKAMAGFPVDSTTDVCTRDTTKREGRFLGHPDHATLEVVDTPGHGGGGDRAEEYRQTAVDFLRREKTVDAVIFVKNAKQLRFDAHDVEAFRVFSEMFGEEAFFKSLIIVFSRWSSAASLETERAKSGETLDKIKSDLLGQLEARYSRALSKDIPMIALDALYWPEDPLEISKFRENANKLWKTIESLSKKPLAVKDIRMVEDTDKMLTRQMDTLTEQGKRMRQDQELERDRLRRQVEEEQRKAQQMMEEAEAKKRPKRAQQHQGAGYRPHSYSSSLYPTLGAGGIVQLQEYNQTACTVPLFSSGPSLVTTSAASANHHLTQDPMEVSRPSSAMSYHQLNDLINDQQRQSSREASLERRIQETRGKLQDLERELYDLRNLAGRQV